MKKTLIFIQMGIILAIMVFLCGFSSAEHKDAIEILTNGKVKPGDVITAENVDLVKELITEEILARVKKGMNLEIKKSEPYHQPSYFKELTEKYSPSAVIDEDGNLWYKEEGNPWPGGLPFKEPKSGLEAIYNFLYGYDGDEIAYQYARLDYVSGDGSVEKSVAIRWERMLMTGRKLLAPTPSVPGFRKLKHKELYYMIEPFDIRGVGNLVIRYVDQRKFDDSYAYVPSVRRIRRLSATQKDDSLSGTDYAIQDFREFNDRVVAWDFKILEKHKPMLAILHSGHTDEWSAKREVLPVYPGTPFPKAKWEVHPSTWVIEATAKDKERIYAKKIIVLDGYTWAPLHTGVYDRQGKLWKSLQNYWTKENGQDGVIEITFYAYDHQADHASFNTLDFSVCRFNIGYDEDYFSIKHLQKMSR